jgi:hypothetical protein
MMNMDGKFTPWFEKHVKDCEMVIGNENCSIDKHSLEYGLSLSDDDCHLSNYHCRNWVDCSYGARIWKATSVSDPEIQKLVKLFRKLGWYWYEEVSEEPTSGPFLNDDEEIWFYR